MEAYLKTKIVCICMCVIKTGEIYWTNTYSHVKFQTKGGIEQIHVMENNNKFDELFLYLHIDI